MGQLSVKKCSYVQYLYSTVDQSTLVVNALSNICALSGSFGQPLSVNTQVFAHNGHNTVFAVYHQYQQYDNVYLRSILVFLLHCCIVSTYHLATGSSIYVISVFGWLWSIARPI